MAGVLRFLERPESLPRGRLDFQPIWESGCLSCLSIRAGLAVIGPKIQWIDQWSIHGVGQGTRAHKTAGNRAYPRRGGGAICSFDPLKISLFLPCPLLINSIVPQMPCQSSLALIVVMSGVPSHYSNLSQKIPCSLQINYHVPSFPKTPPL